MNDYKAKINKRLILITDENDLEFRLQYNLDTEVNLNGTAKFIIKKCFEDKSVIEIVELILQNYHLPDKMKNVVYNDVINILNKLWELGIIKWCDNFPNSDTYIEVYNNFELKELNIQDDVEIFKKYSRFLWNSYTNLENEKNLNMISMQLITKTTKFYKITNLKNNNFIYIAVQFDNFSNQVIFKGLYCESNSKILDFNLNKILEWIINREINISNTSLLFLKNIPILFFSSDTNLSKILKHENFNQIGLLKKEVKNHDIEVYISYIFNKKCGD